MVSTDSLSGQVIFRILNVPFTANAQSWGFLIGRLVMGVIIAAIFWWGQPLMTISLIGLGYGILIILSLFLHILGHLIGGKIIHAPMDENFITPQLIETRYHNDPENTPKRIHLIRTLAGVFTTFAIVLVSAIIWRMTDSHWFLLLTIFNLFIGIYVSLPLKGVDGEVILRELRRDSSLL